MCTLFNNYVCQESYHYDKEIIETPVSTPVQAPVKTPAHTPVLVPILSQCPLSNDGRLRSLRSVSSVNVISFNISINITLGIDSQIWLQNGASEFRNAVDNDILTELSMYGSLNLKNGRRLQQNCERFFAMCEALATAVSVAGELTFRAGLGSLTPIGAVAALVGLAAQVYAVKFAFFCVIGLLVCMHNANEANNGITQYSHFKSPYHLKSSPTIQNNFTLSYQHSFITTLDNADIENIVPNVISNLSFSNFISSLNNSTGSEPWGLLITSPIQIEIMQLLPLDNTTMSTSSLSPTVSADKNDATGLSNTIFSFLSNQWIYFTIGGVIILLIIIITITICCYRRCYPKVSERQESSVEFPIQAENIEVVSSDSSK